MCPSLYDHVNSLMRADVCTEVEKDRLPAGVDYIERDLPGVFVKFSAPIDLRELANVAFGLGYAVKLQPHDSEDPKKLFVGFVDVRYESDILTYKKPIECFSKAAEYLIPSRNSDVLTILSAYQRKVAAHAARERASEKK
ncbi:MAG: hypothetical protein HY833_00025 [Candidatus Aenigmarchaeota archaeon]|nr:hypothetical protein [Candidatus Aenigmarchaeota archaeon]